MISKETITKMKQLSGTAFPEYSFFSYLIKTPIYIAPWDKMADLEDFKVISHKSLCDRCEMPSTDLIDAEFDIICNRCFTYELEMEQNYQDVRDQWAATSPSRR